MVSNFFWWRTDTGRRWFVAGLLFAFPVFLLTVRGGVSVCFTILLIAAVFEAIRMPRLTFSGISEAPIAFYMVAMAAPSIATFLSQVYHQRFALSAFDGPSRFLLAIPIYLMARQIPIRYLSVIQYGIPLGAIGAALLISRQFDSASRLSPYFLDFINFGNLAMTLVLLSVLSINWDRSDGWALISLKAVGFLAGVYNLIMSGTRGAWIAVPPVFILWWLLEDRVALTTKILAVLAVLIAGIALFFGTTIVPERVNAAISDVSSLSQVDGNSIAERLQVWGAALYLFEQNPLFGIGPDQFSAWGANLVAAGYLSEFVASHDLGNVHNELLRGAVLLGVPGLVSTLLAFFVPLAIFLRAAKSPDRVKRTTAVLGCCFVASYFVFGMSIDVFSLKTTVTFYTLIVAILLAIITNRLTSQN